LEELEKLFKIESFGDRNPLSAAYVDAVALPGQGGDQDHLPLHVSPRAAVFLS